MSLRPLAAPLVRLCTLVGVAASLAACARGTQQTGAAEAPAPPPPVARRDTVRPAPADTAPSVAATPPRPAVVDTTPSRVAPAPPRATARAAPSTPAARTAPRARAPRGALGSSAGLRHMAYRDAGSDLDSLWPVKGPAPLPGSILPGKRIIAFYGNPLSRRMGILGEFDPDVMLRKLDAEVAVWNRLDPSTPAQPALHLIVLVANAHPGPSGKYRTRHDSALVEKVYRWARSRNALLFLDLQVGHSTLQQELPWIEKFLVRPDVHLGIDPEFSMKTGAVPGTTDFFPGADPHADFHWNDLTELDPLDSDGPQFDVSDLDELVNIDFDPTNSIIGNRNLIRVAVAWAPEYVLPLWGTYCGPPDAFIEMNVTVNVTAVTG